MRILLAHNSLYYPSHGGGDKSNRLLIEALAARGHACRVVARVTGFGEREHESFLRDLAARNTPADSSQGGVVVFRREGAEIHTLTNRPNLRGYFAEQIGAFEPDVILTSTDDPAQLLLDAALKAERARVVFLARATLALPFGPDCAFPSEAKTAMLRRADAAVGVSQYVADYIRRFGGIDDAVHVPISLMEPGPWPALGRFENEFVALVNPCAVKGIAIFCGLARRMPEVAFAAVPTWGTNEQDRAALNALPNVRILDPVDNIDRLLERTRVLLVPSLWAEARSRIVLEAMLRGVPVIASDVGGIPEAKMGVDYLLPVNPIEKYQPTVDENMVPVAQVPVQDISPWEAALRRLIGDPAHFARISEESRRAALSYCESLSAAPFESVLARCVAASKRSIAAAPARAPEKPTVLQQLSPEKRRLLALRLKKMSSQAASPGDAWFGAVDEKATLRLFCFPHAGGGAAAFAAWAQALAPEIAVTPARLPGREKRAAEEPLREMGALVSALHEALRPHIARPFAFFGHSMGAVVAFELARLLRRHGEPLPVCLFASAARAPQFRRGHVPPPEPSEEQFLDELRKLEGVPRELLEQPELLRLLLPPLKADAALYRNYVYCEDAPLPVPIRTYGGNADPNVRSEHLEGWGMQTTGSFAVRIFPGGHFYPQVCTQEFLHVLAADVKHFT